LGISSKGLDGLKKRLNSFRDHGVVLNNALMLGRQDVPADIRPEDFFSGCGFTEIRSLDITKSEGADIIHDMNYSVPSSLFGKFDFIFDGGTMEHVFDTRIFLNNCVWMLRVGGLTYHGNPLNNFINHGFYQFSPALYFAFYKANGYVVEQLSFIATAKIFSDKDRKGRMIQETIFETKDISKIERFGLSSRIILPENIPPSISLSVGVWVRKQREIDKLVIPTQPFYSNEYRADKFVYLKKIIQWKKTHNI
jgi:hypothetical protein